MPYTVDEFILASNDMQALCSEYAGMPNSQADWDGVVARIGIAASATQTTVQQTQTRASQRPYTPVEPAQPPPEEPPATQEAKPAAKKRA